jgi:hypothetical protein
LAGLGVAALATAVAVLTPVGPAHAAGLQTNVAPTLASWGNRTVAVVTGTDGRIFYDWWDLGGGGHGWREVPGGGRTDAAPAASLVANGSYVFITVKGVDGNVYLNQGTVGGGFVGWRWMGFATGVAPAMATSNNRSVVVATGGDGQLYYTWWDLGSGGNGWHVVPDGPVTRYTAGAALLADGATLELTIQRDFPNHFTGAWYNHGTLGGTFNGWGRTGVPIVNTSAMATWGNRVLLAMESTGGLSYTVWDTSPYGTFPQWYNISGMSIDTPPGVALVARGTYMFVLVRGSDSNLYLNQGTPGGGLVGWQPAG